MADVLRLTEAALNGEIAAGEVARAVKGGAPVDEARDGFTALMGAVKAGNPELVGLLLRLGASANLKDARGVSPLHMAVFDGSMDIVQGLLKGRADADALDRHGQTPLFFAPNAGTAALLGASKCNVNILNNKGQSALHLAAHAGLNDTVLWLCDHVQKRVINTMDKHGRTAIYCAAHSNLKSTMMLLQDKGADVSLKPNKYAGAKGKDGKKKKNKDKVGKTKTLPTLELKPVAPAESTIDTSRSSAFLPPCQPPANFAIFEMHRERPPVQRMPPWQGGKVEPVAPGLKNFAGIQANLNTTCPGAYWGGVHELFSRNDAAPGRDSAPCLLSDAEEVADDDDAPEALAELPVDDSEDVFAGDSAEDPAGACKELPSMAAEEIPADALKAVPAAASEHAPDEVPVADAADAHGSPSSLPPSAKHIGVEDQLKINMRQTLEASLADGRLVSTLNKRKKPARPAAEAGPASEACCEGTAPAASEPECADADRRAPEAEPALGADPASAEAEPADGAPAGGTLICDAIEEDTPGAEEASAEPAPMPSARPSGVKDQLKINVRQTLDASLADGRLVATLNKRKKSEPADGAPAGIPLCDATEEGMAGAEEASAKPAIEESPDAVGDGVATGCDASLAETSPAEAALGVDAASSPSDAAAPARPLGVDDQLKLSVRQTLEASLANGQLVSTLGKRRKQALPAAEAGPVPEVAQASCEATAPAASEPDDAAIPELALVPGAGPADAVPSEEEAQHAVAADGEASQIPAPAAEAAAGEGSTAAAPQGEEATKIDAEAMPAAAEEAVECLTVGGAVAADALAPEAEPAPGADPASAEAGPADDVPAGGTPICDAIEEAMLGAEGAAAEPAPAPPAQRIGVKGQLLKANMRQTLEASLADGRLAATVSRREKPGRAAAASEPVQGVAQLSREGTLPAASEPEGALPVEGDSAIPELARVPGADPADAVPSEKEAQHAIDADGEVPQIPAPAAEAAAGEASDAAAPLGGEATSPRVEAMQAAAEEAVECLAVGGADAADTLTPEAEPAPGADSAGAVPSEGEAEAAPGADPADVAPSQEEAQHAADVDGEASQTQAPAAEAAACGGSDAAAPLEGEAISLDAEAMQAAVEEAVECLAVGGADAAGALAPEAEPAPAADPAGAEAGPADDASAGGTPICDAIEEAMPSAEEASAEPAPAPPGKRIGVKGQLLKANMRQTLEASVADGRFAATLSRRPKPGLLAAGGVPVPEAAQGTLLAASEPEDAALVEATAACEVPGELAAGGAGAATAVAGAVPSEAAAAAAVPAAAGASGDAEAGAAGDVALVGGSALGEGMAEASPRSAGEAPAEGAASAGAVAAGAEIDAPDATEAPTEEAPSEAGKDAGHEGALPAASEPEEAALVVVAPEESPRGVVEESMPVPPPADAAGAEQGQRGADEGEAAEAPAARRSMTGMQMAAAAAAGVVLAPVALAAAPVVLAGAAVKAAAGTAGPSEGGPSDPGTPGGGAGGDGEAPAALGAAPGAALEVSAGEGWSRAEAPEALGPQAAPGAPEVSPEASEVVDTLAEKALPAAEPAALDGEAEAEVAAGAEVPQEEARAEAEQPAEGAVPADDEPEVTQAPSDWVRAKYHAAAEPLPSMQEEETAEAEQPVASDDEPEVTQAPADWLRAKHHAAAEPLPPMQEEPTETYPDIDAEPAVDPVESKAVPKLRMPGAPARAAGSALPDADIVVEAPEADAAAARVGFLFDEPTDALEGAVAAEALTRHPAPREAGVAAGIAKAAAEAAARVTGNVPTEPRPASGPGMTQAASSGSTGFLGPPTSAVTMRRASSPMSPTEAFGQTGTRFMSPQSSGFDFSAMQRTVSSTTTVMPPPPGHYTPHATLMATPSQGMMQGMMSTMSVEEARAMASLASMAAARAEAAAALAEEAAMRAEIATPQQHQLGNSMKRSLSPAPRAMRSLTRPDQEDEEDVPVSTLFSLKRDAGMPVPKTVIQGCECWQVTLTKRDGATKYGFSHVNGKTEFAKERARKLGKTAKNEVIPPKVNDDASSQEQELGPECLTVRKVTEGCLLDEWNHVHPDAEVRLGDRIVAVNGKHDINGMQKELRSSTVNVDVMRYPDNFEIELVKCGRNRKLGFKFEKPHNERLLELNITEVSDAGLLENENRRNIAEGAYHLVVFAGMRITQVNDVLGDAGRLAEELRRSDARVVKLHLRRMDVAHATKAKMQNNLKLMKAAKEIGQLGNKSAMRTPSHSPGPAAAPFS